MNIFLKQRTLLFVTHKSSMMTMVDKIILKLETESIDFIDLLEEPSK